MQHGLMGKLANTSPKTRLVSGVLPGEGAHEWVCFVAAVTIPSEESVMRRKADTCHLRESSATNLKMII